MVKRFISIALTGLILLFLLCSCLNDSSNLSSGNADDYYKSVAFGDIFSEFEEISELSAELLNSAVDEAWWESFDYAYVGIEALSRANSETDRTQLNEVDLYLAQVLDGLLDNCSEAFGTMDASRNQSDSEIFDYAYYNFDQVITNTNSVWNDALNYVTHPSATEPKTEVEESSE